MKGEKKTKKKGFWKTVGIVLAALLSVALLGGIATVSLNSLKERNPANLLKVDDTYLVDTNTAYGLSVEVDEDGIIKFDGQSSRRQEIIVQKLKLEPGVYTLSGINKVDITKMDLCATWGKGNIASAGTDSATFELKEETEVTVSIVIAESNREVGDTVVWQNKTIKPVLVKGTTAGDFYA